MAKITDTECRACATARLLGVRVGMDHHDMAQGSGGFSSTIECCIHHRSRGTGSVTFFRSIHI